MGWLDRLERRGLVDSTQAEAERLAARGALEGTSIVADAQHAGRGRRGRTWHSAPGAGLWMTTVLRPTRRADAPAEIPTLSLVAGVAAWKALRTLGAQGVGLKWPNDLVARERKLGGILLEASFVGDAALVLVGIGINIAPATALSLPSELQSRYVGLTELVPEATAAPDALRERLIREMLRELEACYHRWQVVGLAEARELWSQADALADATVRIERGDAPLVGVARGLGEHGELCVETPDGLERVTSGEVLRVRPAGG